MDNKTKFEKLMLAADLINEITRCLSDERLGWIYKFIDKDILLEKMIDDATKRIKEIIQ